MGRLSYIKLRKQITYDKLITFVREGMSELSDPRNRSISYSFIDILMSGFAVFSLKYPSLLCFDDQTSTQRQNLLTLFGIGNLCSDSHLRKVLDEVPTEPLKKLFPKFFKKLSKLGILKEYRVLGGRLACSVDGVHYYDSEKVHCARCLVKKHDDGRVSYSHSMLCAVLVHPDKKEVFPLASEEIRKQDGETKNDCEQNAAKRINKWMSVNYPDEKFIMLEDALYSTGPHIRQILENGNDYVIRAKRGSSPKLFEWFENGRQRHKVKEWEWRDAKTGNTHRYGWRNNMPLNESHPDIRVNVLMYEEENKKGKISRFSWITSIRITKNNVGELSRLGRSRWKIENETFNTLKNQGYNFEHNYGHGSKNLSSMMSILMLIAFTVDQIWQKSSQLFNRLWDRAKSKRYLWELLRAVFFLRPVSNFQEIYKTIAAEFSIQLE